MPMYTTLSYSPREIFANIAMSSTYKASLGRPISYSQSVLGAKIYYKIRELLWLNQFTCTST